MVELILVCSSAIVGGMIGSLIQYRRTDLDLSKMLPRDEIPLVHTDYTPLKDYEKPLRRTANIERNTYEKDLKALKNTEDRVI